MDTQNKLIEEEKDEFVEELLGSRDNVRLKIKMRELK